MKTLTNTVALITGGASGIGRATAQALARRGAKLAIADIDAEAARRVAGEIVDGGGQAFGWRCDVAEEPAMVELRDAALARFGRVDIVMNNVGVISVGLPDQIPLDAWRRDFEINLFSVIRSNAVFVPMLLEQRAGHIVITSSFAGLYTYAFDRMPYAAAKAALVQIAEGLAIYLKPQGIGVTCLCPGPVKTNIGKSVRVVGTPTEMRGPGPEFSLLEAGPVGEMVVEAILADRFMVFTHPEVTARLVARAGNWDDSLQRQIREPHRITLPTGTAS